MPMDTIRVVAKACECHVKNVIATSLTSVRTQAAMHMTPGCKDVKQVHVYQLARNCCDGYDNGWPDRESTLGPLGCKAGKTEHTTL